MKLIKKHQQKVENGIYKINPKKLVFGYTCVVALKKLLLH